MPMRFVWGMPALLLSGQLLAADTDVTYWLFASDEGDRWCGYTDQAGFNRDADARSRIGIEAAKVSYQGGKLAELVYEIYGESGDWTLLDVLTPAGDDLKVRRSYGEVRYHATLEATIHAGKVGPLHVISADGSYDGHFPFRSYPVLTPKRMPFMPLVIAMQAKSSTFLCMKVRKPVDR
jgi:hypothetical protein